MGTTPYFARKIAIVTGAASGIGRAIATYLAAHDATVVLADRNLDGAREVESILTKSGGRAHATGVDVTKREEVESLIQDAMRQHGRIDLLINNAGVGLNGEFQDMTLEQFAHVVDVNLWGTVYGCHFAYPIMMRQGSGQIVNVASLGGLMPGGLMTSYVAAKHAVVGFTLGLRAEAKQYAIRVNALCPGFLDTPIHDASPDVSAFLNSEKNRRREIHGKYPTAEDCVASMMRGVRRNQAVIIAPAMHRPFWWLYRLFPAAVPLMWSRIIRAMKDPPAKS